jgi:hypothetical protein
MIYSVVPADLAPQLLERLRAYYADDPEVEVIVDRRHGERRARGSAAPEGSRRERRDRRRPRVPGEFPPTPPGA